MAGATLWPRRERFAQVPKKPVNKRVSRPEDGIFRIPPEKRHYRNVEICPPQVTPTGSARLVGWRLVGRRTGNNGLSGCWVIP
jgi:hypothetical protein